MDGTTVEPIDSRFQTDGSSGSAAMDKAMRRRRFKALRPLYLFLIPAGLAVVVFEYFPMYGIILAFKDYSILEGYLGSPWVGLQNFRDIFADPDFIQYVWYTFYLAVLRIVLSFPMPIMFALLLNELRVPGFKRITQTVSYLPHFISWVVVSGIVYIVLAPSGPLAGIWEFFTGDARMNVLIEPRYFPAIVTTSHIWKTFGYSSIVYLAAISGISSELYEAAAIDGAGRIRMAWSITLPSILATIVMLFILNVGTIMKVGFGQIWNLQNPVIRSDTHVIATYTFVEGLRRGNFSYATAIGLFENLIGFVMIALTNRISKKVTSYGIW